MEIQDEHTRRYQRIKYAGVVHVRGMFRRVWRPRQLEIDHDGILRYYASNAKERLDRALQLFSLPDFKDIEVKFQDDQDNWDHMSMSDGGGLDDSELLTASDSNRYHNLDMLHHNIHNHRPKATMKIISARLIDFSSIRDIKVGLPPGTFGFVFSGKSISDSNASHDSKSSNTRRRSVSSVDKNETSYFDNLQSSNAGDIEHLSVPRDYLCYVDSLVEAERWVDVLKSASVTYARKKIDSQQSKNILNENHVLNNCVVTDDDDSVDDTIVGAESENILILDHARSSNRSFDDISIKKNFYTIVSVIGGYKLGIKKWIRLFRIHSEIYFEVRLLLLSPDQLKIRGRKRTESDAMDWKIQELVIYRTFLEVQSLVNSLKQRHYNTSVLEKLIEDLDASTNSRFVTISEHRLYLKTQINAVGRIMREITSDVSMCNSVETKKFLSLNHNDVDPRTTEDHFIPNVVDNLLPKIQVKTIAPEESIDHFVSSWLISPMLHDSFVGSTCTYIIQILNHATAEIACSVIFLYLLIQFLYSCSSLIGFGFRIRLDFLLFFNILAYWIGYRNGKHSVSTTKSIRPRPLISKVKQESPMDNQLIARDHALSEIDEALDDDILSVSDHLSSPLPIYPAKDSCWSQPNDQIFRVRGATYLKDRIKCSSGPSPFKCRGVDMWLTETPERNIARLPCVLGGKLAEEETFIVNFLLPFGNFVTYFTVDRKNMAENVKKVWDEFVQGDQQYRDARLKLLPVVLEGPWIVKRAVGPGTAPALLGESIPLQYFFSLGDESSKAVYEVDVIITASRIAKGILSIVKGHTKHLTIALGFIIEASKDEELPETVLASCQIHSLHLERCMELPSY